MSSSYYFYLAIITICLAVYRGKKFEALVARLQRAFNKTAKVICNEKIPGKRSGRVRQIDISIRTKIGTENVLMIISTYLAVANPTHRTSHGRVQFRVACRKRDKGRQSGRLGQ